TGEPNGSRPPLYANMVPDHTGRRRVGQSMIPKSLPSTRSRVAPVFGKDHATPTKPRPPPRIRPSEIAEHRPPHAADHDEHQQVDHAHHGTGAVPLVQ